MTTRQILALCLLASICSTAHADDDAACDWRVMTDAEARTAQGWGKTVAQAVPAPPAAAWCDYGQTQGTYEMKMDYSFSKNSHCGKKLQRAGKALCQATGEGCFPSYKHEVMYRKYAAGAGADVAKDCNYVGRMSMTRESETWKIETPEQHMAMMAKLGPVSAVQSRLESALSRSATVSVKASLSELPTSCDPDGAKIVEPNLIMNERSQNEGTEYAVATQEWCFGANVRPRASKGEPKPLTAALAPLRSVKVRIEGAPDAVREIGKRIDRKAILAIVGKE